MRRVQRARDADGSAPIDSTGLVLLAIWVGSLQIMLDTGTDAGWFDSGEVILLAVDRIRRPLLLHRLGADGCASCRGSASVRPSQLSGGRRRDKRRVHDVLRHLHRRAALAADADGLYGCMGRSCSGASKLLSTGAVAIDRDAALQTKRSANFRERRLSRAGGRLVHARRVHDAGRFLYGRDSRSS